MKYRMSIVSLAAVMFLAGQAVAQTDAQGDAAAREADMERRLMEAEQRMSEAARQIAEITRERLPGMLQIERRFEFSDKPRLGVTIDGESQTGPVEGVTVMGVTPGSAASDAGLRPGDIMTAVNGETLSADSANAANERLLDFMKGVEAGDVLKVEYLRDGKIGSVELEPRVMDDSMFAWRHDGAPHLTMPHAPNAPAAPGLLQEFKMQYGFPWAGTGLGELELVELNKGLGRYFGTDSGLLVISAPKSDAFELQEGDVIQSIDGRVPKDARHAMRILGSYQGGETLKLGIMRDRKKRTLEIEIPVDQHGALFEGLLPEPQPAQAPRPVEAPRPVPESAST